MKSVLLVSLLAFVVGCSSSTSPGDGIEGTWAQVHSFPGMSTTMTLHINGSAIHGSGDWCGELLPCGKLSVSGFADDSGIHLSIQFDNGSREFFDGHLLRNDSLV